MVQHAVLTLTGSAQLLSAAITPGSLVKQLILHAGGANAAPVYVGGPDGTLSSTVYGFRIEAATAGVPPAPTIIEAVNLNLSQVRVLGTNNETLHILIITS